MSLKPRVRYPTNQRTLVEIRHGYSQNQRVNLLFDLSVASPSIFHYILRFIYLMNATTSLFPDHTSASGSGYEGLDHSSEGWLADCLINDTEMQLSPDDEYVSFNLTIIH